MRRQISKVSKIMEEYLYGATYSYEITSIEKRKDEKDYKFTIDEYGPGLQVDSTYNLFIKFDSNEVLNEDGDVVNN